MKNQNVTVPRPTMWEMIDTYDLRTVFFLSGLVLAFGGAELFFVFLPVCFLFYVVIFLSAPDWRFIELEPYTAPTCFVSVVLHWLSLIGLYVGAGFKIWDPVDIKFVSVLIGFAIYAVALLIAWGALSFDNSEDF